jgi:cell division protein FtsZ
MQPTNTAPVPRKTPLIKVIGLGGAGLHALTHMSEAGLGEVAFAGAHTDARVLGQCGLAQTLLLGSELTRGLGAGGDPDIGRAAAESAAEQLRSLVAGPDLIIVVAGLGGGTGSGAAPVAARLARESGALVLALVALPFEFEGTRRQQQAQLALRQLKTASDAVICLPNQKIARLIDEKTTFLDALKISNELLAQGVRGLWRLITCEGLINVDFADLCRVVRGRQAESSFATAEAMGENRARELVAQLVGHPLLDNGRLLSEADAVLVSLAGGLDLTLKEVGQVMEQINRTCEGAQVVMGAAVDATFQNRLAVTLVATQRNPPNAPGESAPESTGDEAEPPAAQFPTSALEIETQHLSRADTPRPPSRFVPPAPALSPEKVEELLLRQTDGSARQRKKVARMRQGLLPLEVVPKGRFAKSEPTIHRGADLDTPTYIRRGVALN